MKIYKTPDYMLYPISISLFWFLRGINQIIFYGLTGASTPLWSGLCLVFGLLHLISVIRKWKKIPNEAQPRYVNTQPSP